MTEAFVAKAEQVIAELTAVKGIGAWTAQMFLHRMMLVCSAP